MLGLMKLRENSSSYFVKYNPGVQVTQHYVFDIQGWNLYSEIQIRCWTGSQYIAGVHIILSRCALVAKSLLYMS